MRRLRLDIEMRKKWYLVAGLLFLSMLSLGLAENSDKPCRVELVGIMFFTAPIGSEIPNIAGSQDELEIDWESAAKDLLEEKLGSAASVRVDTISLSAFINSNGKFFANVHLVYAYRFLHHHKPDAGWELKQQNNLMDNGIDYYQVGSAGVRSAKAAVLNAKRKILSGLEKELKEQCKEHQ